MNIVRSFVAAVCCLVGFSVTIAQDDKSEPLIVVDGGGKESSLAKWKFVLGTEKLPWSNDAKGKAGAEFLAFRDDGSTTFVNGIVSYVPISSLRKIEYDDAKKSVTALVRTADKDVALTGTTKFKGINKLTLEGETELAGLGKAVVRQQGGQPKGIAAVRFPAAKATDALPAGRKAVIVADDKEKSKHAAVGLVALYKVGASARSVGSLWFKTAVKVDLDNVVSLRHIPSEEKKSPALEFEVTLKDGAKHPLILLDSATIDGAAAKLIGLYGRVDTGWKLFPLHAVAELTFEGKAKD